MAVGDELSVYCDVLATGTTSLSIAAEAVARTRNGEATTLVAKGTFKFVLIGEDNRPRAVAAAALPGAEK
jgi:acyl-CoA thioesterase YciA